MHRKSRFFRVGFQEHLSAICFSIPACLVGESWFQNLLGLVEAAATMEGTVDWRAVTKTVLRSQPPRAIDVPDMCAFVQKWGGMPSGSLVKELGPLLNHYMPSHRVVAGAFFKQLSELRFSFDELPAFVIQAILFRQVVATAHIHDCVSPYITRADLAGLLKKEKRQLKH